MPISDLEPILTKEAVIATYPAAHLRSSPKAVERTYQTYARTHIPLGDTTRYVDTIFKWVGGANKGAFVGAVAGGYGHGKTSFQIHVWEQSTRRKILAVPPFSWTSVSEIVDGTAAWVEYRLSEGNASLARKAKRIYEEYKEKSLQEVAKDIAAKKGQDVDDVMATLKAAEEAGNPVATKVTPERVLDYCANVTEVLQKAGYAGLLVLLDEPEVTAKHMSTDEVALVLFELANGLAQRQGEYGVFVCIPENFLANVQARFTSLPARLQVRRCFPRLRDLYGPDFAAVLWERYVKEFRLGKLGSEIVSPEALQAIGQVGSSTRTDLSYGPRTVVSAFRQMVHTYQETSRTYRPEDLVDDCLEENVYVLPDYTSLVRQALSSPEAGKEDTAAIKLLAAFPNGMPAEIASASGLEKRVSQLARRGTIAYKSGNVYGLVALRQGGVVGTVDQLREAIADIVDGFSPNPRAFEAAADAFMTHVIPMVFERRQGQQLLGWEYEGEWLARPDKTKLIGLSGAFRQTEKDYPAREVAVAVGPQAVPTRAILPNTDPGEFPTDILFHFAVRWAEDEELPQQRVDVSPGDPRGRASGYVRLVLDFADESVSWELREELQELLTQMRTPLAFLYLVQQMESVELPREHDAAWNAIRSQALRDLVLHLVDDASIRQQAGEQAGRPIASAMPELLGTIARLILGARYPDYHTLIRAPHWSEKVGDYVRALKNQDIALACKRGRQPWCVAGGVAAKAFGTSQMNLTGGAFDGFESLVEIRAISRDETEVEFRIHPLEEAVKQAVTEDPKSATATIQGKECPYLSLHDLVPLFMGSGYQQEELQRIVEIGDSRGTFRSADLKGRRVVYCPPIDPEEMKAQLREKLGELTAETEGFAKLLDYQSSIDLAALGREIDEVRDEAEYDAINTRIVGAFEHNRARIPGYTDRLAEAIRRSRNEARELGEALQRVSAMATGKASAKATSTWSAALSTHVAQGIRKVASSKQTECKKVVQKADTTLNGLSSVQRAESVRESVALLTAGFGTARDLREDSERVRNEARTLQTYLDEHQEWLGLLSLSDSIYDDIVELKNDPSHAAKGAELLGELQKLWDEISDHLSTRGLLGLESHKQYRLKLQQLAEKRRTYVQRIRDQFDKDKEGVNLLLTQLGILSKCTEVFNPADADGSYTRLYEQAAERANETYQGELDDLQAQRRELLYTNKILNRIGDEDAAPVLASLEKTETGMSALLEAVAADWIRETAEKPERERKKFRAVVDDARAASKNAKTAVREARPPDRKPSANADVMLQQVSEGKPVDLKDLVLYMMGQGGEPEKVLELSLECLGEVFKIGRVQVKVEKVSRR